MLIVDSQIHIWKNHLPTNAAHRQVLNYTQDDVLREMDEAGVDAAVIHPPGWDPQSNDLAVERRANTPTAWPFWAISRWIARKAVPCWRAGNNVRGC